MTVKDNNRAEKPLSEAKEKGVGYRSPPKHTRFKKGVSGNPGGRPKGAKSMQQHIYELGDEMVQIKTPEGTKIVTLKEAAARKFFESLLKGQLNFFHTYFSIEAVLSSEMEDERQKYSAEAMQNMFRELFAPNNPELMQEDNSESSKS